MSIWQNISRPIFILAPMEDVTDTVFRRIISSVGRPHLYFTEFTNVDGFLSQGREQVAQRLKFLPEEKPLIAQIWGLKPENFYKAAQELEEMGFDGIDLNMGCPQKDVTSKGACSALINNHTHAKEIIQATKEGAGKLPVSVKTRLGFKVNQREDWISFLLEQDLAALTIHGRTAAEMSVPPAHWDEIGKVVEMRDEKGLSVPVIGNGDVRSIEDGLQKVEQYKVDGIMVGRGIFHNPWLFDAMKNLGEITLQERMNLLLRHVELYESTWQGKKPFQILKKYFKIYVADFPGASDLRAQLMETKNGDEVRKIVSSLDL